MKRILVPTDFSASSRAAENLALALAVMGKMEVHFLHIQNAPQEWVHLSLERERQYPEVEAAIAESKNELNELISQAKKIGVTAKEFLHFNYGRIEILKHQEEFGNDLIIMGSHGSSGVRDVLGSNASRVVRHARVPVLVVKNQIWLEQIKNVVFASTFEEDVLQSFQVLRELTSLIGAKIHLLNVNTPSWFTETDEMLAKINEFRKKANAEDCEVHIFNGLNEERGIEKFSRMIHADMITLTTHGRKGILQFIAPGITEGVMNHAEVPVLSINFRTNENNT